jgi:putative ABC transport system permease protein
MKFISYLLLSLDNIRHRRLRSWLTMIGIFIGVAAVVSLISLGQGMQNAIDEQFEKLGSDKILIMPDVFAPPGSITTESLILTKNDLDFIKNIRGVEGASGYLSKIVKVNFKDEAFMGYVGGVAGEDMQFWQEDLKYFEMEKGRVFEEGEKYKAIVGFNYYNGDVFDRKIDVKDKVEIEGQEFKIVGVMKKTGDPNDDQTVFISKEVFRELLNVPLEESVIMVKTADGFDPEEVAKTIERKLRRFRGEKEDELTFKVQTYGQLLDAFTNIFGIVQAVLIGIAGISLLVGGIGIMNTMYTSVLERTKEIGIMKAVGAKNSDILSLFLVESGLLGLFGGILGIGLGLGFGKIVEWVASNQLGFELLKVSIDPVLIIGSLVFTFVVGSLSGMFPARQAARMKPVDALRYE